jgi:hypothetical protein
MTEKDLLEQLISDGFMPFGTILTPERAPQYLEKAPPGVQVLGLLPLWRSDNERRMFGITQEETLHYAQQLVAASLEIVGYSACGYISAVGPDAVAGHKVFFCPEVVATLVAQNGNWRVNESQDYPSTIELRLEIEGNDTAKLSRFRDDLEKAAVFLSISDRHGFVVSSFSSGARSRAQPFSVTVGLPGRLVRGTKKIEWADIDTIWNDVECRLALEALRLIFSQVTNRTMIVAAWSAIEEIFGGKPEHILTSDEIDRLMECAKGIPSLGPDKLNRFGEAVRDTNRMATKNRNERIAEALSHLTGDDEQFLYTQIRTITRLRGKSAHTLHGDDDIQKSIEFIERVLWAYIGNKKQQAWSRDAQRGH